MAEAALNKQNILYTGGGEAFSGSRVVPCGRTDRKDKANSGFSQFCERA